MKNFFCVALMLLTTAGFAQEEWANFEKYADANQNAKSPTAVFMGNSITEGWYQSRPDFFTTNNFAGRGISGQVTAQMLVRFRADVIDLKPKAVVILGGTNDVAQNQGYIALEHIYDNIASMADLAHANNIKVYICSILPVYDYPWKRGLEPADKIRKVNQMLQDYVKAKKSKDIIYVDYHSKMVDERGGLPEKYSGDGVHTTAEGFAVMESIILPLLQKIK